MSEAALGTTIENGQERLDRPSAGGELWLLPVATLLFHLVTAEGYGYFRDELYYLSCGLHPGWGYVDHPPLIGWVAALVRSVFGTSLLALRFLPAAAAAATVLVAMKIADELGGGRRARWLAALGVALGPGMLAMASFLSMNVFDVLFWAVLWWILARWLRLGEDRLWLAFGAVAGLGLLNKISVFFLGLGVVLALLLARRGRVFGGRWIWLGGALAFALFAPYLIWQIVEGWPTLTFISNAKSGKMLALSPGAFLGEQVLLGGPLALPLWGGGVVALLASARLRGFRVLGWAFLAVLVLLIGTGGKPYYFIPAFAVAFSAGAVWLEGWARVSRARSRALLAYGAVLVLGALAVAPLVKPLLPIETFVRYQAALGLQASSGERHSLGRLPQHFADMHGWPELADEVAAVHRSLPATERGRACVFGQNYGQAGAIDLFGAELGLPRAISGHNSYHLWGPGECDGEVVLVIGDRREVLEEIFEEVELGARFTCRDCMPYEADKPIWIARRLKGTMAELWPRVRNFN